MVARVSARIDPLQKIVVAPWLQTLGSSPLGVWLCCFFDFIVAGGVNWWVVRLSPSTSTLIKTRLTKLSLQIVFTLLLYLRLRAVGPLLVASKHAVGSSAVEGNRTINNRVLNCCCFYVKLFPRQRTCAYTL
jgi:hypothetical protein